MQKTSSINQLAESSVLASVAIAVAATSSGKAAMSTSPEGYGPLSAAHHAFLKKSGFPESCLKALTVFSAQNQDGFAIQINSNLIEFITSGTDTYVCKDHPGILVPPLLVAPHKNFGEMLFITPDPLAAILGVSLGIPYVAVTDEGWMAPGVALPLPDDAIHRARAAKPDARLLALAEDRKVILDGLGHDAQLGHSLQYHIDCQVSVFVSPGATNDLLSPVLMIDDNGEHFKKVTQPLQRLYESYPYAEFAGQYLYYHYPLFYLFSDRFVPSIEKDVMVKTEKEDGEKEWVMKRFTLDGVPLCRIRRTMIVTQPEAAIISLDRNAGLSTVIEDMEGVTATRREVIRQQLATEYTVDSFIAHDYTQTQANKLPEFRSFLAAQKGQPGHPIAFGTHSKGFFGVRFPDGETVFPAGYITEDRLVTRPGVPPIVPLGAKAAALSRKGTSAEWRKPTRIMLKNASIAALMGFAASPLIHPFVPGVEPGMIVLVGASGRGKTTAMRAIASMISEPSKPSKPGSYIMTFRTTENGLEGRLEAKNHCPSLIDEIGAASTGMNWSAAGYMIANGAGKLRMNADSTAREIKTWSTQTIASGEESFASKMNANGQAERGGILFRVVDLHLEGVPFWEHLEAQVRDGSTGEYAEICKEYGPGAVTATQVMDTLFSGLELNHGHAWWEMVERMLEDEYRQKAADRLTAWQKTFTSKLDDRAEIIVHRRSVHLASAMAGLELILDTFGDELPAAERQFIIDGAAAWVETYLWRAGLPEGVVTEESALYERVIEKIAMNPGRFYYPASDEKPRSFKEYWGVNYGGCGVTIFMAGLKDMCAEMGEDYKRVRHALVSQSDDKKWTESNNRPAPGAAPMRGLCSPETFRLLGYGYRA